MTVVFGEGITSINAGGRIFGEDTSIKNIVLPSTLTYLGEYSLDMIQDYLETVVCYAVEPPTCGESYIFEPYEYSATLYVPAGSKEKYESADVWKNFTSIVEMTSEEDNSFTISSAGYATYYTENEYTMPEGVTGSTVTSVGSEASDGGYYLTMSWEYEAGETVPAGTALVLQGEAYTYEYEVTSTGATAPTDNLLLGSTTETTTTGPNGDTTGYVFYELTKGTDGTIGFYWANDTGVAFQSEANKAWLALTTEQARGAKFLGFGNGDTTGITSVEASEGAKVSGIYTLQGVRVSDMSQKGVYIVNGKKILVK